MKQINKYIIEKLQISKAKNQDSIDFDITFDSINNMIFYCKFYINGYDGLCQITVHTVNKKWGLIVYTDDETFAKFKLKGTEKSMHPFLVKKFVPFVKEYVEFEINDYPDMSLCMTYDKYVENVNTSNTTHLPKQAAKKFVEWLHYFTDYTGKNFASYNIKTYSN